MGNPVARTVARLLAVACVCGSLAAQTNAVFVRTSDTSTQIPRLTVTTSTAVGALANANFEQSRVAISTNAILRLGTYDPPTDLGGDIRYSGGEVLFYDDTAAAWETVVTQSQGASTYLKRNAADTSSASAAGAYLYVFTNGSSATGSGVLQAQVTAASVGSGSFYGVDAVVSMTDNTAAGILNNHALQGTASGGATGAGATTANRGLMAQALGNSSGGTVDNLGAAGYAAGSNAGGGTVTNYGVWGNGAGGSSVTNYGVYGLANGATTGANYGISGFAQGSSTANYGVTAQAITATAGTNFGLYASASAGGTNWAGWFQGDVNVTGSATLGDNAAADTVTFNSRVSSNLVPTGDAARNLGSTAFRWANLYLSGSILNASGTAMFLARNTNDTSTASYAGYLYDLTNSNATDQSGALRGRTSAGAFANGTFYGIAGESSRSDSAADLSRVDNIGVSATASGATSIAGTITHNYAVYGRAGGTPTNGTTNNFGVFGDVSGAGNSNNYGVYGNATGGTTGTNYGVYGQALAGATNWAGYFSGNVNITGSTTLGDSSTDRITATAQFNSALVPSANNTYNLGSATLRWATAYAQDMNVAGDYNYSVAQTRYFMAPVAAVVKHNETTTYDIVKNFTSGAPNYFYFTNGTAGSIAYATAPVYLPHGATVTELQLDIFDNDAAVVGTVDLCRVTVGSSSIMATCAAVDMAALQTVADSTITNAVIDNQNYSYGLRYQGDQNGGTNLRFYHVRITYTVPAAD